MRFQFTTNAVGDFDVSQATTKRGDALQLQFTQDIATADMPAVNIIVNGRFSLGPFSDGRTIEMGAGHSSHLNAFRPAGKRSIISLEDGSTYVCIRPTHKKPYESRRVELVAGESYTVRKGATVVVATGSFTLNTVARISPLVFSVQASVAVVTATTPTVIVELWLK